MNIGMEGQHNMAYGSCSLDGSYQPSVVSSDVEISDASELSNSSWMFENFEGDEDDIFKQGSVDDASNAIGEGRTTDHVKEKHMTEDEMEEFNEPPYYEDDLLSMQGSDDESKKMYADFNEDGDVKNPQLELGMKFSGHTCFREALRALEIARGFSYKLKKKQQDKNY